MLAEEKDITIVLLENGMEFILLKGDLFNINIIVNLDLCDVKP
jgi:hypothetical protein